MRCPKSALLVVLSLFAFVHGAFARKALNPGSSGRLRRSSSGRNGKVVRSRRQRQARHRRGRRYPPMTLVNPNRARRNRIAARVYDRRGRFRPRVVRELTNFLRCRRTGRRHQIHPRLIRRVYEVWRHFGGRPLYVYSGYRHPSVSWTPGSRHTQGRALDFRVKGIRKRRLRDYLMRRFDRAGVGYYTRSPFVHFDLRRRSAFWIDFSGRGERPRYARNARRLLALERRGIPIRERRAVESRPNGDPRNGDSVHRRPILLQPLGPAPDSWARVASLH